VLVYTSCNVVKWSGDFLSGSAGNPTIEEGF
jgi:hypothetical protein